MTHLEIVNLAKIVGVDVINLATFTIVELREFARLVAENEREICAKLCDKAKSTRVAKQIRLRGQA